MTDSSGEKDTAHTPDTGTVATGDLRELVVKSIQWSEAVYNQNKKIQKHLKWMSILSTVRLLLFLIPIIIGIIYLPELLSGMWEQYQSALGISGNIPDNETLRVLIDQFAPGSDQ